MGRLDAWNVVWTEAGRGSQHSMPLGNGDIGLNLWLDGNGDLLFYISKTDAWDEHGNLLKPGRVRCRLEPPLVRDGQPFRQWLDLATGTVFVRGWSDDQPVELRLWVDANAPAIRLRVQSVSRVGV